MKTSQNKLQLSIAIGFCVLMVILSYSRIVYVPISSTRILDLSLIPIMFAAMIGGYRVGIPAGILWALLSCINLTPTFSWEWIVTIKMTFPIALTYFYRLFKKAHWRSPYNVYRAVAGGVLVKDVIVAMGVLSMFPEVATKAWIQDSAVQLTLDLGLCTLSMMLIIKHLRQIHILNGVRKKGEMQHGLCDR